MWIIQSKYIAHMTTGMDTCRKNVTFTSDLMSIKQKLGSEDCLENWILKNLHIFSFNLNYT